MEKRILVKNLFYYERDMIEKSYDITYHENGKLQYRFEWCGDFLHGRSIGYHPDGTVYYFNNWYFSRFRGLSWVQGTEYRFFLI